MSRDARKGQVWFDGLIQELCTKLTCNEWDPGREKGAHTSPRRGTPHAPTLRPWAADVVVFPWLWESLSDEYRSKVGGSDCLPVLKT